MTNNNYHTTTILNLSPKERIVFTTSSVDTQLVLEFLSSNCPNIIIVEKIYTNIDFNKPTINSYHNDRNPQKGCNKKNYSYKWEDSILSEKVKRKFEEKANGYFPKIDSFLFDVNCSDTFNYVFAEFEIDGVKVVSGRIEEVIASIKLDDSFANCIIDFLGGLLRLGSHIQDPSIVKFKYVQVL